MKTVALGSIGLSGLLLVAGRLPAQSLPPYSPVNPVAASRSGLATQPWLEPGRKWRLTLLTDYASSIEYAEGAGVLYILDAELLRLQATLARSIGAKGFVLAELSFNGAYDGFLDGFLEWYHNLTGLHVSARDLRPKNEFDYEINLPGGRSHHYQPSSGFLGDLRLGAGLRHSRHWQSTLSLTLPTSTAPAGYGRGTVSFNATTTLRSEFAKRFVYEGTLSAGFTPRHGELEDLQQQLFLMVTQGVRARLLGPLHAYGNVIYHSPYYQDAFTKGLNGRELTGDLGFMLRFRRGPEWILGMTQDLEPTGPAIDVAFRLGARW